MASFCSLCNVSVPADQLQIHRTSATHLGNFRLRTENPVNFPASNFPTNEENPPWASLPYVETTQWGYKCLWCQRMMQTGDQMDMHLNGKEHSRRCINSGISPYGDPTHEKEATEYVRMYGHDPYARLAHWPDCIEESGQFWTCRVCKDGKKKYQTQRDVNDHLRDESHISRASYDYQSSGPGTPSNEWPDCIVKDGHFWKCTLCNNKFNAPQTVEIHLEHPKHLKRVARTNHQFADSSFESDETEGCYLCMDLYDDDDHLSSLGHICAMYCTTVDGFA